MDYSPSAKELSHFPFLKKAQDHIKKSFPPLDQLLKEEKGTHFNRAGCQEDQPGTGIKKNHCSPFPAP